MLAGNDETEGTSRNLLRDPIAALRGARSPARQQAAGRSAARSMLRESPPHPHVRESTFRFLRSVRLALEPLATVSRGSRERGAVFTRPSVMAAILDLSGYRADRPLHQLRFLEPSFGHGEFLLAAVDRLIQAYRASGGKMADAVEALSDAIRAVELHQHSFEHTQALLRAKLIAHGATPAAAGTLCQRWLLRDDFLLCGLPGPFDVIAGNPPYVRPERIPEALLREYRARFRTLFDRADLYIAFYEKALDLLESGTLGFICANRWMKNKYGGPLRAKIVDGFRLRHYIWETLETVASGSSARRTERRNRNVLSRT